MEIVLIRHGQPEWVREGLNVDNPPLTERGHLQAAAMADFLRDEHFDEVLCSPLRRARQTAGPLFVALDRPETVDPWLEEIRNPIWQGTPQEKSAEAYRQDRARRSHERWEGLEGGEPVRDFVERIHLGCTLFLAERGVRRIDGELAMWEIDEPERRIALVAHAGTNSVIICHLLGLAPTPWEWDRFVIGHASVSRLCSMEMGDGHSFSLTCLSDDEFLARTDRTL
jgi:probable phosphoglycerate mutase